MQFTSERREVVKRAHWSHVWARMEVEANKALVAAHAEARAAWVRRGRPKGEQPAPVQVSEITSMQDLRHFYASVLIKHRGSVKTVQRRLGHSKPSITLDTYTHPWPDDEDTTRAAVEAVLGDVRVVPSRSIYLLIAQVKGVRQR